MRYEWMDEYLLAKRAVTREPAAGMELDSL